MTRRAAGFTLLELIVALAIMGLVMVGVVQGVRFGIAGWQAQARHIDSYAELDGVDRVMRELLTGIIVTDTTSFSGAKDRLSFTGRLPNAIPGTLRLADLTFAVADHRLVLSWRLHRHATESQPGKTTTTELLRNIASIQFNYWPSGDQAGAGWQDSLSGQIPSLIRIRITPVKGDPRKWPDLVATPVVTPG